MQQMGLKMSNKGLFETYLAADAYTLYANHQSNIKLVLADMELMRSHTYLMPKTGEIYPPSSIGATYNPTHPYYQSTIPLNRCSNRRDYRERNKLMRGVFYYFYILGGCVVIRNDKGALALISWDDELYLPDRPHTGRGRNPPIIASHCRDNEKGEKVFL